MFNDPIQDSLKILNMPPTSFTKEQLTEAFRNIILQYHPDKCKDKDANKKAAIIIKAYNDLKPYAHEIVIQREVKEKKLFDFTKPCRWCKGIGYDTINVRIEGYDCIKCKDTGIYKVKCNKCNNGKFTLKSGRIVDCKSCSGTGVFQMTCNHHVSFSQQFWYDYFNKEKWTTKKVACKFCNGTGKEEYEPINPVIRKGAILK